MENNIFSSSSSDSSNSSDSSKYMWKHYSYVVSESIINTTNYYRTILFYKNKVYCFYKKSRLLGNGDTSEVKSKDFDVYHCQKNNCLKCYECHCEFATGNAEHLYKKTSFFNKLEINEHNLYIFQFLIEKYGFDIDEIFTLVSIDYKLIVFLMIYYSSSLLFNKIIQKMNLDNNFKDNIYKAISKYAYELFYVKTNNFHIFTEQNRLGDLIGKINDIELYKTVQKDYPSAKFTILLESNNIDLNIK